jgi:hypothetical protein
VDSSLAAKLEVAQPVDKIPLSTESNVRRCQTSQYGRSVRTVAAADPLSIAPVQLCPPSDNIAVVIQTPCLYQTHFMFPTERL